METTDKPAITVECTVDAAIEKVWECFTKPEHITQWSFASDEWHTPHADNDLRPGGSFNTRMEAKDGSVGFDFSGKYDVVTQKEYIEYTLGDGRKVKITFSQEGNQTKVTETFDPESTNSPELQKNGWQSILDNFQKYASGTN